MPPVLKEEPPEEEDAQDDGDGDDDDFDETHCRFLPPKRRLTENPLKRRILSALKAKCQRNVRWTEALRVPHFITDAGRPAFPQNSAFRRARPHRRALLQSRFVKIAG
jgi:hypothetical protein